MSHLYQNIRCICLMLITLLLTIHTTNASHSVGADLTYTCVGNNTYEITLTFYRDCFSSTDAPGIGGIDLPEIRIISATCGLETIISLTPVANPDGTFATEISPICEGELANSTCNGGPLQGVEQYTYTGTYTFPQQCKDWILSYSLCCRNAAITNSVNPSDYELYVESLLNNLSVSCNNSPVFTTPPVPYICADQPFNYNHGVYDVEGDSLVYTLIDPLNAPNDPVPYVTGLDPTYPITTTPPNNVFFDNTSGQMEFTPNNIQIGIVAVLVKEYRNGQLIGSTIRDMQVVVISCMNNVPTPDVPTNIIGGQFDGTTFQVCAGNTLSFDITVADQDVGDMLTVIDNLATSIPEASLSVSGTNPVTASFSWATTSEDVGNHSFATIIEDDACPIVGFQVFGYEIFVPGVQITAADTLICPGISESIQLDANQVGSLTSGTYTWSPITGLNNPNIKNPIATIDNTITYTVTYNDGVCMVTDEVNIQTEGTLQVSPDMTVCTGQTVALEAAYIPSVPFSTDECTALPLNCADTPSTFTLGTGLDSTGPTNVDDESGTPFLGYFHDGRTQYLYTAADLNAEGLSEGLITEFALEVALVNSWLPYNGFTIKMGCTDVFTFQNSDDFITSLEEVYSDTISPQTGWNTYILDTPYQWDGSSNLLVEICFDNNVWSAFDHVFYTITPYNSVLYGSKDNDIGCFIDAEDVSDRRPNTRFTICEPEDALNINFSWSPSDGLSDPNIPNPLASPTTTTTYTVTAITPEGCEIMDTVQITVGELGLTATASNLSCGAGSGMIDVEVAGGMAPYMYDWNDDALDGTEDPTGLSTGMYSVTVTDVNGCQNTASAEIITSGNLSLSVMANDVSCFGGNDGTIDITLNTGTAPFTYTWDSALPDSANQANLSAGTYNLTVTDAEDCVIGESILIGSPDALMLTTMGSQVTCDDNASGSVSVTATGGTGAYAYDWDGADDVAAPSGLLAGTYTVTVTDANGCTETAQALVDTDATLNATAIADTLACFGDTGGISLTVEGGTTPYTFDWDNAPDTQNPDGLGAGTYQVTITDAADCIIQATSIIIEPEALTLSIIDTVGTSCESTDNGRATAVVSGGVMPYTFLWDNSENTPTANMLTSGTHSISITDANDCMVESSVSIPSSSEIEVRIVTTDATCYGENDGTISLTPLNGTPPFSYSLNGETYTPNPELFGLAAGTYDIHIQDATGCLQVEAATINAPPELVINLIENTNINFGDSIVLQTAVNQPDSVSYSWSSTGSMSCNDCANPVVMPSHQTAYTVQVINTNGCTAEASVTIFVDRKHPVFIPNAFTPNDDNINDVFMVHGNSSVQDIQIFRIFDRWGEVVFENQNTAPNTPENGWNGTSKGQALNPGIYIYYIEVRFVDGTTLPYSGELTLIK